MALKAGGARPSLFGSRAAAKEPPARGIDWGSWGGLSSFLPESSPEPPLKFPSCLHLHFQESLTAAPHLSAPVSACPHLEDSSSSLGRQHTSLGHTLYLTFGGCWDLSLDIGLEAKRGGRGGSLGEAASSFMAARLRGGH